MKFGLSQITIQNITSVLQQFPDVEQVVIYGSRAKGNFKPGSDIDFVFKGTNLTSLLMTRIDHQLDDLLLPYNFDLSIYNQIDNAELTNHIERIGKIFYEKEDIKDSQNI
ncbi:nucleotidyltransferase domain-containing protein [Dyadobacter sp. NIV53]|uniref:nucleotidyltransferase domain-containing protein n=1 Tax=Dyadobacter sp. NIV53 TaxID=2861765 RepID=UPI001C885D28|nr:nucleotidyltransferase domain-containing protein [Dyadobacter sp. NIV53]